MNFCYADSFSYRTDYVQSTLDNTKKYFNTSDPLPDKYLSIFNVLVRAIPNHIKSWGNQKISLIKSEKELANHFNEFKKAIPKGKLGKFSFFVFDHSCTFLAEMYYGNPKASKKFHEICLYSGPINLSYLRKAESVSPFDFDFGSNPSRYISEAATDLDDAELYISEDDELAASSETESPDPDRDLTNEYNNFYERSMTVQEPGGYNFLISTLPSLKQMNRILFSGEEIKLQFQAQVCGVSSSSDSEIQLLFQTIYNSILSGNHDE